ncbi:zinc knuckle (CCHC-type) family protein [Actinidia rufa]|uniref:Zinc knuckle (CCHC-type) family protein n=1 Tax=Actinidia rufa TaxID=165716 RepID=A0A7J0F9S7_9ERIC|nr:zinc knuckle (CCHC-type) family protein [Actinidia rufa]
MSLPLLGGLLASWLERGEVVLRRKTVRYLFVLTVVLFIVGESNLQLRHIVSECSTKSLCWNCREPGHMAGNCPNEGICHTCGKAGHRARDCTAPPVPPGDIRLCNNCFKQGHIAVECTNDKACKNCRKTGHLARDCTSEPVCNLCNITGHVARECPKGNLIEERGGGARGGGYGYRDIICRSCHQPGHMSRDCMIPVMMICNNCGGRGHHAYECPSGRFMDRFPRRY